MFETKNFVYFIQVLIELLRNKLNVENDGMADIVKESSACTDSWEKLETFLGRKKSNDRQENEITVVWNVERSSRT